MNQSSHNQFNVDNNSRDDYQLTFQDYVVIIRIHFKLIIFLTLLGLLISTYRTYSIPLSFQATATVEIRERPGANMVMDFSGNTNKNRLVNEIQVIMSRSLAKEVIKDLWDSERRNNLHIFGTRKFYPKGHNFRNKLKSLVSLGIYDSNLDLPKKYKENYNESIGEQFAGNILSNLNVTNIRNTNIIKISFSSPNADEARRIANIIAETYIGYDSERSKKNARKTVEFLDSLVFHQQIEIEEKEKKIRDFKLKNNMYSLDGDASSIIVQLNTYEAELYNIKAEINIRKEKVEILDSKLTKEEKSLTGQLTNDINSQLISLRIEIGRLETQVLQNTNIYGKNHDAVIELNNRIKATENRPVYWIKDAKVYMAPLSNGTYQARWIRRPKKPNWTYIVIGEKPLYNSAAADHQDFELHPLEQTDLIIKILQLSGVTIKDYNLVQVAAQEEAKNIQQEKS